MPFFAVLICAILFALPIYWLIVTSLKDLDEVFADPLVWWPRQLIWSNYPQRCSNFPSGGIWTNTITIAVPVAFGTTISSAFVAYAFSRLAGAAATSSSI